MPALCWAPHQVPHKRSPVKVSQQYHKGHFRGEETEATEEQELAQDLVTRKHRARMAAQAPWLCGH
jgi:hypothetical protein